MDDRRLLTPEEVAEILHISVGTIYNRCAPKAKDPLPIKPRRLGRSLRFLASDVYRYIETL